MTRLPRGLAVLGFVLGLSATPLTAAAAPAGLVPFGQDAPAATSTDAPADVPADMPADVPAADMAPADDATPTATPTPTATATPTIVPTPTATPTPIDPAPAIKQVIQHGNDEQVQAIATRNLSLTSDTTTADQFQALTNILQDLLNNKVNGITLLKLDWGPITVAADGSSAKATTYESWRIVSQAGSIDYDPVRNDYTLVLDNGTWKIKSSVQVR